MAGFSIVEFTNERTIEVVPSSYVLADGKCWWPSINGPRLQKLLTNKNSQPDLEDGLMYDCKVIKNFDDYYEAKKRLAEAEFTSSIESENDSQIKSRKNRKRKQLPDFIDPFGKKQSSSSSDDSEESQSLLKGTGVEKKKKSNKKTQKSQKDSQKEFTSLTFTSDIIPVINIPDGRLVESNRKSGNENNKTKCGCQKEILDEIRRILDENEKNRTENQDRFQEVILKKLNEIQDYVKDNVKVAASSQLSTVTDVPAFPATNLDELKEIEDWLAEENNVPILIQHLSSVGGTDVKDSTRRILKRLFKGDICCQINWIGKNNKFAFMNTMAAKVIISCVKMQYGVSEKVVEDLIKSWFRYAKDRDGGHEKRRNEKNNVL